MFDDPEVREWFAKKTESIRTDLWPKMRASLFAMAPLGPEGPDAEQLIQIGAALMLGKPLIIMLPKGAQLPPKVRMVADLVIEVSDDPGEKERAEKMYIEFIDGLMKQQRKQ